MGRPTIVALALSVFASAGTTWAGTQETGAELADLVALVQGNNMFAGEFGDRLPADKGNLFFSPYSMHTVLALTSAGARQQTEAQLAKALSLSLPSHRLHPAVAGLVKSLLADAKVNGCEFRVSNALWGQKGYGLQKEFLLAAEEHYGAGLNEVDFDSLARPAGKAINAWCEKATGGGIKELLKNGSTTGLTQLVLANTVYYSAVPASAGRSPGARGGSSGRWAGRTPEPFTVSRSGRPGLWRMMEVVPGADPSIVGGDQAVIIFATKMASDSPGGADKAPSRWAPSANRRPDRSPGSFQIRSELDLRAALEAMKMTDAFSKSADFSAMNGWNDLHVSDVVHKAAVKVGPSGTEAVAATAVIIDISARDPVFVADCGHPPRGCIPGDCPNIPAPRLGR